MSKSFNPYADESAVLTVGGLTLENRLDRVSLSGSLDITLDKEGLAKAEALMSVLTPVLEHLRQAKLPDQIGIVKPGRAPNPFEGN